MQRIFTFDPCFLTQINSNLGEDFMLPEREGDSSNSEPPSNNDNSESLLRSDSEINREFRINAFHRESSGSSENSFSDESSEDSETAQTPRRRINFNRIDVILKKVLRGVKHVVKLIFKDLLDSKMQLKEK